MNGYIPARTISGIHLPPPILPTVGPAQVGLAPPAGFSAVGAKHGIQDANDRWTLGRMFAGAGLGVALGYLGGAVGGGTVAYYLLPKGLGETWRTGLSIAGGLLVLGPVGASLGAVIGAQIASD